MLDFLSKITAINGVLTLKQHLIFGIIRLRHPITSIEEVLILWYTKIRKLKIPKMNFLMPSGNSSWEDWCAKQTSPKTAAFLHMRCFSFYYCWYFRGRIYSVSWIPSIKTRLFPRTPITVSWMKHPTTGRTSCFSLQLKLLPLLTNSQDRSVSRFWFLMIPSSNVTGVRKWNCLQGCMTMWSTNSRKDLHFWHLAGLMGIVSSRSGLTCFLLPKRVTAIRKCQMALTTAPMVTKPGKKAWWQKRMPPSWWLTAL